MRSTDANDCRDGPRPHEAGSPPARGYEKPRIRTLDRRELLSSVENGSKFPARGFAG